MKASFCRNNKRLWNSQRKTKKKTENPWKNIKIYVENLRLLMKGYLLGNTVHIHIIVLLSLIMK